MFLKVTWVYKKWSSTWTIWEDSKATKMLKYLLQILKQKKYSINLYWKRSPGSPK